MTQLTEKQSVVKIIDGPSLDDLKLSHSLCLSNHLQHKGDLFCEGHAVRFTTEDLGSESPYHLLHLHDKTHEWRFPNIILLAVAESDDKISFYTKSRVLGLKFQGLTLALRQKWWVVEGFYCPKTRDGYLVLPDPYQ